MHPRSPEAHSVFGTGALLLCQPSAMVRVAGVAPATSSFRTRPSAADITPWNWLPDLDSHQDKRLNRPPCYFDTTWQRFYLALPTGIAPASIRLEDECLIYSATAAFGNGQRGRICTCDPSVPSRVRWLLRYALKNGGPEGICTLNPPADNGALG